MRVRTKLRVLFILVIGISLATSAVSMISISQLSNALHAPNENLKIQLAVEQLRSTIKSEVTTEAIRAAIYKEEGAEERLDASLEGFRSQIAALERIIGADEEMQTFLTRTKDFMKNVEGTVDRQQTVLKISREIPVSKPWLLRTLAPIVGELAPELLALRENLDSLATEQDEEREGVSILRRTQNEVRTLIPELQSIVTKWQLTQSESGARILNRDYLSDTLLPILNSSIDGMLELQRDRVRTATEAASRSERRVIIAIIVASVTLLLVAVFGLALFKSWLIQPIDVLSKATHDIAHGEYDTKIALGGNNEFGRLARDVETMSASIEHFQSQLVEKERMAAVGEMTASVAHNVRNPLASIRAIAQTHRRNRETPAEMRESFGTMMETVDRADRWLKDLLTALRPVKIEGQEQDLASVLHEVAKGSRIFAERKGITFDVQIAEDLPTINLDLRKFEQALIVLISNAIEASENDSTVHLRSMNDPSGRPRVKVEVEDHGIGMDENVLKKLFTPYFTTKKSGVGLGLCLAQKIIFGHRGTIDVDSAPDQGCRMTIWLPTTSTDPEPS